MQVERSLQKNLLPLEHSSGFSFPSCREQGISYL